MAVRREDHRDFDRLAVDHVLGGLSAADQARFRDHLADCVACRARVTELRGIAATLDATARSERARVLTRVPARPRAVADAAGSGGRRWPRLLVAGLIGLTIGGLAFWNLQLRVVNAVLDTSATTSQQALTTLVEGQFLPADFAEGVRGLVVADAGFVALDLTALPVMADGDVVVLWATAADGDRSPLVTVAGRTIEDGRLVMVAERPLGAVTLTVEIGPFTAATGRAVVTASLDHAAAA